MSEQLDLRPDDYSAPHVKALVEDLAAELDARYGDGGDPEYLEEVTADELVEPDGAFLTAWVGGELIGCGAVRRAHHDPALAEIKRMYVVPSQRGRGFSRQLLAALEARAAALGYRAMCLETGTAQPEAIALYESSGWTLVEPYGKWASSPLSRCYGKQLAR